jgi:colicin import membrane protein
VGLRFNRTEPGVWISAAAHALCLAAGLFAMTSETFPEAQEGIPVEIITDNQFSEITRGERDAPEVKADARPRVDRVAEVREQRDPGEAPRDVPAPPTRPAEMKVADQEAEAAAAPPPPPPPARPDPAEAKRQEIARAELAKAAEREEAELLVKQEAQAKAEAEAKAKAEADAKAKALAEAKAKAEADAKAKALAEAKAKAEADAKAKAEAEAKAKAVAEAKAKAKAEAEAKARRQAELADKFNPGKINELLQTKERAQSSGATGSEINRTASLGTATGTAQRLNPSMRDALIGILQEQLHRCWVVPVALQSAPKPPVPSVRIKLNQDGSLAGEPAVINRSPDPLFGVAADSATRAARRCSPLRIPAQFAPYYQDWKDLVVNFNLRDMG